VLFSGDTLLPEITPTPAIQFHEGSRFPSLPRFLDSLATLTQFEHPFARCFPGHGEPFGDVGPAIEANLAQARERTARVEEALREGGQSTVYGIAERLYPRALRRRFWQIIATVQGHLDVLAEAGRAEMDGGRWR
jgi:glyoxylase-like metal-dependent hydrolase (beta-lactamase superfamily II)